jgi:hypothetical protein
MSMQVLKNISLILLVLFLISLIWLLNQKKNYNPVLSLKTNLSFKSDKDLDYLELSSSYKVLQILRNKFPDFNLVPAVKIRDFSVIGRVFKTKNDEVSVFEYANSDLAKKDLERLSETYGDRMFLYKNLIVLTGSKNEVLTYLKENLK